MQTLTSTQLAWLQRGGRLGYDITVTPVVGSPFTITEADIIDNNFTLDRSQWSSSKAVEIGNADAAELSFVLDNYDGRWNNVRIEGATMVLSFDINGEALAGGYFIADKPVKSGSAVKVYALDYMAKFNQLYDGALTYPATLLQIVQDACTDCGVTLGTTSFTNSSYSVTEEPTDSNLTYHQLVAWVAQLAGCNAWMDENGELRLTWYGEANTAEGFTIDASMQMRDVSHGELEVQLTGVEYVMENTSTLVGAAGYVFRFTDNPLLQSNVSTILTNIYNKVKLVKFLPFEKLPTVCLPNIWPGDIVIADAVSFVPADDGAEIAAAATGADLAKVTNGAGISGADLFAKTYFKAGVLIGRHKIGTRSDMVGVGETATVIGYANGNGMTDAMRNAAKAIAQTKVESLDADWIRTGKVRSTDGKTYFDLDNAEIVQESVVAGKNVKVTVSTAKPFELEIDGVKEIYVNPTTGVLVPSRFDVNEDGVVDFDDLKLVDDYVMGRSTTLLPRMDVNGDGSVNVLDLTLISRAAGNSGPPFVEAGRRTLNSTTWTAIEFGRTFYFTPVVVITPVTTTSGSIAVKVKNITETGCEAIIGGSGFSGIECNWIAVGMYNDIQIDTEDI